MNKQEVKEIRKTFKKIESAAITRLCGCYVSANNEIISKISNSFLTLPETDIYKFLEMYTQVLSGNIGDKLINLNVNYTAEDTGFNKIMEELRKSELKDNKILDSFYDSIIENYANTQKSNYLIMVGFGIYDIPGDVDSECQYRYLITAICPVKLSPQGLFYSTESKSIHAIERFWTVSKPAEGFLYPAFNDRSPDTGSYLYYVKTPNKLPYKFINDFMECEIELTNNDQKDALNNLITNTFQNDVSYVIINEIRNKINDIQYEHTGESEPYEISKSELRKVFEDSGATAEQVEKFNNCYETYIKNENTLKADAVSTKKKITFKNDTISLKIDSTKSDTVQIEKLDDGKTKLSITLDEDISCDGILLGK